VESTVDGKTFITARGWDDLSKMISLYEECGITVDKKLMCQYIQNPKIAADFAGYYDLFNKYRSDYQIDTILSGKAGDEIKQRARNAKFDERLSLIGLLLDGVAADIRNVLTEDSMIQMLMPDLKEFKVKTASSKCTPNELLMKYVESKRTTVAEGKKSGKLDSDTQKILLKTACVLEKQAELIADISDGNNAFAEVKKDFDKRVKELKKIAGLAGDKLKNMFVFCDDVFSEGQELLVIVTELTANFHTSKFISKFGCEEYFRHNKELLFFERQQEIALELDKLEI
jgi:hypothetical protein